MADPEVSYENQRILDHVSNYEYNKSYDIPVLRVYGLLGSVNFSYSPGDLTDARYSLPKLQVET